MRKWFAKSWSWAKLRNLIMPVGSDNDPVFTRREKVTVSVVAYGLALILWFMVNMDREFSITVDVPVMLGELPARKALVQNIPSRVQATVSGPGWKLMNFQSNLPMLVLDVRHEQVDVLTTLRDLTASVDGVTIQRVQPFMLTVRLDDRVLRRVPVESRLEIGFRNRYDQIGPARVYPDSVDLSGAKSVVDTVRFWPTVRREIQNVRDSLDLTLPLAEPPAYLQISHSAVRLEVGVSEFTEGEVRVPIRTRGNPRNRDVVYSPTTVTVKYDVPIEEYTRSLTQNLFAAYVPYGATMRDSTGFVVPQIERTESVFNVRIRSVQPRAVAYYHIVSE